MSETAMACASSSEHETVLLMKLPPSKRNAYTMFRSGAAATAIAATTGLQPSTVSCSLSGVI
jgi:DNA-binding NarL/FixJ family response regulator